MANNISDNAVCRLVSVTTFDRQCLVAEANLLPLFIPTIAAWWGHIRGCSTDVGCSLPAYGCHAGAVNLHGVMLTSYTYRPPTTLYLRWHHSGGGGRRTTSLLRHTHTFCASPPPWLHHATPASLRLHKTSHSLEQHAHSKQTGLDAGSSAVPTRTDTQTSDPFCRNNVTLATADDLPWPAWLWRCRALPVQTLEPNISRSAFHHTFLKRSADARAYTDNTCWPLDTMATFHFATRCTPMLRIGTPLVLPALPPTVRARVCLAGAAWRYWAVPRRYTRRLFPHLHIPTRSSKHNGVAAASQARLWTF